MSYFILQKKDANQSDLDWYKELLANFDPYYEFSDNFETWAYQEAIYETLKRLQPNEDPSFEEWNKVLPEHLHKNVDCIHFLVVPKGIPGQRVSVNGISLEEATKKLQEKYPPSLWEIKQAVRVVKGTTLEGSFTEDDNTSCEG